MTNYKRTVAAAKAEVVKAELEAFAARLEAIDAILEDATPHDVLALCAHALAGVAPLCCEAHQDEFKADLLQALSECIAIVEQEQDATEADEDGDDEHQVH